MKNMLNFWFAFLSTKIVKICQNFGKQIVENLQKKLRLRSREECKSCRSRKMLQNASLLAIVAVDRAENERLKKLTCFFHFFNPMIPIPNGYMSSGDE